MKAIVRFGFRFFLLIFLTVGAVAALSAFWYWRLDTDKLQAGWYPKREKIVEQNKSKGKLPTKYKITMVKQMPSGWVSLKQISSVAVNAIMISEDWAFYQHKGIDNKQLEEVLRKSWKKKHLGRGASTISQQLVKNLFLSNERSLIRKWKELILTLKLEEKVSKKRILELYLNVIEFGNDLYGIQPAAQYYFRKSASALNAREAAFLAMLLPNPKLYSVSFRKKELTSFAKRRIRQITLNLVRARAISQSQRERALRSRFYWEASGGQAEFENEDGFAVDSDLLDEEGKEFSEEALEEDGSLSGEDFSEEETGMPVGDRTEEIYDATLSNGKSSADSEPSAGRESSDLRENEVGSEGETNQQEISVDSSAEEQSPEGESESEDQEELEETDIERPKFEKPDFE